MTTHLHARVRAGATRSGAFFLTMLLLLSLSLTIPGAPAVSAPESISTGKLTWGIKESWRSYIGAAGTTTFDGATRSASGEFTFPVKQGTYDAQARATVIEFAGGVHFQSYCSDVCALDTTYSNLTVEITEDQQVLRGDWAGRLQDSSDTDIHRASNVVLATLDVYGANVSTTGGTTTWDSVLATAAEDFITYPAGVALDPVAFSYEGPGGLPDLSERWDTPGAAVHELSGVSWESVTNATVGRNTRATHPGKDVTWTVDALNTAGGTHQITARDPDTLAPAAPAISVTKVDRFVYSSVDPDTNALFWLERTAGDVTYSVNQSVYDATTEQVTTKILGSFTGSTYPYSVTWNAQASEFAILAPAQTAPGVTLHRFTAVGNEWKHNHTAMPMPADYDPNLSDTTAGLEAFGLVFASGRLTGHSLAALSSGEYVYAGGGTVTRGATNIAVPAAQLTITDDGSITARSIAGTENYRIALPTGQHMTLANPGGAGTLLDVRVTDGNASAHGDPYTPQEMTGIGATLVYDEQRSTIYLTDNNQATLFGVRDGAVISQSALTGYLDGDDSLAIDHGGRIYANSRIGTKGGFLRYDLLGVVPSVVTSPQNVTATLGAQDATKQITFTAAGAGTPAPTVQWQMKTPGSSRFADLPGEQGAQLTVTAARTSDTTQYRAVLGNIAGQVVTAPATLTVNSAPNIDSYSSGATIYEGHNVTFSVLASGNPHPTVTWQRKDGDTWKAISASTHYALDGATLTIMDAPASFDQMIVRPIVKNSVATTTGEPITLTVRPTPTAPEQEVTYHGVMLEWTGSAEWQAKPPNGSTANYFSAGVSDGTAATYAATQGGVSILQRAKNGADAPATWDTRGAHIASGGTAAQVIHLDEGTAVIQPDSSAVITWPGAVSVNFYDGLVPFTMSDLTLNVDKTGTGTLTADLEGYAGDMANPDAEKKKVTPQQGVTIATFTNVVVDAKDGITIEPHYSRVSITTPQGATAQQKTGNGWGAWPQSFVDFHHATGLASYFYSTGGTYDQNKKPAPLVIGFDGAVPEVPEPTTPEPEEPTIPPTPVTPDPSPGGGTGSTAVQGSLVWGVKESFRTYIKGPVAKGKVTVSQGAAERSGVYWFGQSATTWKKGAVKSATDYAGSIRFYGHNGELDVTFSQPAVHIVSEKRAELQVTVNGTQLSIGDLDLTRATTRNVKGGVAYSGVPVTLTTPGANVFAYGDAQFYPPGTVMDPVSFVIGSTATTGPGTITPPATATPDTPQEQPAQTATSKTTTSGAQGSLRWGVKSSFRSYITGPIAKGAISVSNGAAAQGSSYWFGQSATTWKKDATTSSTTYRGAVRFTGHAGVLDLTFSDPIVRIDSPTQGSLLVRANGRGHVAVGNLALTSGARTATKGSVTYSGVPVTLTASGAQLFSYGSSAFYGPGTAMDPVTFTIGKTATSTPAPTGTQVDAYTTNDWTPPAEPPANTGIYIDPEMLTSITPGSEITAVADGFEPNEKDINVVLYSTPLVLEDALTADATGRVTWTGLIPLEVEPGEHTLTFQGSINRGITITIQESLEPHGCMVTGGALTWGFKESFRSYISGTIANGDWATTGGATYNTPEFTWSPAQGVLDTEALTGQVQYPGTVQFTGHKGLLDTTISNPTIVFAGGDTAYLLLDVDGVTMDDAMAGNTQNRQTRTEVSFVELDLTATTATPSSDGLTLTFTDVPATITTQGYEAFPNYEAGTAFDPVSFTVTVDDGCAITALADTSTTTGAPPTADTPTAADTTEQPLWLWICVALLLTAGTITLTVWLIRRRTTARAHLDTTQLHTETAPEESAH